VQWFDRSPHQINRSRRGSGWRLSLFVLIPLLAIIGTIIYQRFDTADETNNTALEADSGDTVAVDDDDAATGDGTGGNGPQNLVTISSSPIEGDHFGATWARTDLPVSAEAVNRTWMWGPEAISPALYEPYAESPGGIRLVQYFDKTRMEINDPQADPDAGWFVTNGLLAMELVTGEVQIGEDQFEEAQPAEINVVGDPDDMSAPTYASFAGLLEPGEYEVGDFVVSQVDRSGTVASAEEGSLPHEVEVGVVTDDGYPIGAPFWEFMNSTGTVWHDDSYEHEDLFESAFYATGLPITSPYWATVSLGGEPTEVLIQVFERRVLTYTPDNPPGWQVEAGNVGLHYFQWRYGELGENPEEATGELQAWSIPAPPETVKPFAECYEPRPSEDQHDLELLPAESRSIFQQCQIVAYYGFPSEPQMGIVGEYEPEEMIGLLNEQVAEFEEFNGFRTAIPALELIYAVAQAGETADGTYLARMSNSMVEEWIEIAEEHDLLIMFDIQMGTSTVEREIPHLLPYLENPRVHLALDPEFVTTPGNLPGLRIGGMEAAEINRAQHMLSELVEEHNLPNKILMIHQFIPEMILNKQDLEDIPGVDLVIHQDGFGAPAEKIANYDRYIGLDGAQHGGFKIFYRQDEPVMTPEELMMLIPQPDVITYQ
jgi:hypothetical protein